MYKTILCCLLASALLLGGCAAKRPVLYPNAHLKEVGQTKADLAVDECVALANEYKAGGDKTKEIAKDAGKAAVIGAGTGAVIGAITGNIGRTAAIGGAGAATATMGAGLMRSDEPDPVFKKFVEQCLHEKGYQPIGWR